MPEPKSSGLMPLRQRRCVAVLRWHLYGQNLLRGDRRILATWLASDHLIDGDQPLVQEQSHE
jgi:hypothetical protein